MSKLPIRKIVNSQTGEEEIREMTLEEFATYTEENEKTLAIQLARQSVQNAKESAIEKLAALGLSLEEIAAITGA